ncbi:MAG: hypothetical protein ACREGG_03155 [Candidatus Saccharimonadales bacterium]
MEPDLVSMAFPLSIVALFLVLPLAIVSLIIGFKDLKKDKPKARAAIIISIFAIVASCTAYIVILKIHKNAPPQTVTTKCYSFTIPSMEFAATVKDSGNCHITISGAFGIFNDFQINAIADNGALKSATSAQIDQKLKAASDSLLNEVKNEGLNPYDLTQGYITIDGTRAYQLTATAGAPLSDFGKLIGWDILYVPKPYIINSGTSQIFSWYFEGYDSNTKNLQSVINSWKWQ